MRTDLYRSFAIAAGIAAIASGSTYGLMLLPSQADAQLDQRLSTQVGELRLALADMEARLEAVVRKQSERADRERVRERAAYANAQPERVEESPPTGNLDIDDIQSWATRGVGATAAPYDLRSLENLVSEAIREEREQRRAQLLEAQRERLSAFKRHRDGPFGEHNLRVNSLTEKLALNDSQASLYYDMLLDYEEQARALYEGVDLADAWRSESDSAELQWRLDEIESAKSELNAAFREEFTQELSAEQAARYEQLPTEEVGLGPDVGASAMALRIDDLGHLDTSGSGDLFRDNR